MLVRLINVADYEFKENKCTEMPLETLCNLCGVEHSKDSHNYPSVRLFKGIDDFKKVTEEEMEDFDINEKVRVMNNGNIFVFLKGKNNQGEENKETTTTTSKENATTNTKENKGE